ncbi:tRNA1(Val) (adenine(37)-N6)-methyltransferase [Vibrio sp. CAU 1672]|uniref:tRNA1(Val) (adenine(37)-N6)-methyltransferase n=1 Tax=Vibrio sp. CAU 1672 TaxID=3032594 RepID=UPI0023DBC3E9|nr:tRNA1(Val) (adenine(37)-N6)-methyltransferase [Vibrio sp. CAU 1672]MDF2155435.1 tRNA1(Val) (adenine(37)-N6)-methyltransferase [Vibrio sp. CAU 1672]
MKSSTPTTKGFTFKQFSIAAGDSGMPVSTDGVLLGAWAACRSDGQILDIGTGTGLLALMCAQRFCHAHITALDIEPTAIAAAQDNFAQSPWPERLALKHRDVQSYAPPVRFDSIVCNPPYFNSGEQAKQTQRAIARHTSSLPHDKLLEQCARLLTPDGSASFILPIIEGERFITMATNTGWHLTRRCQVKPSTKKPVHRLLFELSRQARPLQEENLTIHTQHGYSEAFIQLTRGFYLKM